MTTTDIFYSDTWFDPFFERLDENKKTKWRSSFERGQMFWSYVFYSYEDLELWRPKELDSTRTTALSFCKVSAGGDAFQRSTPLVNPSLETAEEFIVIKAKKRPVILLCPPLREITATERIRYGEKINKHLTLVIPLYSIQDKITEQLKYPPDFIEGVRLLKWPQFFFIPSYSQCGIRDSIASLDSLMAIPKNHLEPLPIKVAGEALDCPLDYLLDQINFFLTEKGGEKFLALREQLIKQ